MFYLSLAKMAALYLLLSHESGLIIRFYLFWAHPFLRPLWRNPYPYAMVACP